MRKENMWVCLIREDPNSKIGALGPYCFQKKKKTRGFIIKFLENARDKKINFINFVTTWHLVNGKWWRCEPIILLLLPIIYHVMNCDKNYEIFSVSSVALIFWAKMCIKKTGEVKFTKAKQKKKKQKTKKVSYMPFYVLSLFNYYLMVLFNTSS